MSFAYLAVLLISCCGMLILDRTYTLVFWRKPLPAALIIFSLMSLFLVWDVLGIYGGIFFRGAGEYMTGVTIMPELPLEEIVFLFFLSYQPLIYFGLLSRVFKGAS